MRNLLPTVTASEFLTDQDIQTIWTVMQTIGRIEQHIHSQPGDRNHQQLIAQNHVWDYYSPEAQPLRDILDPALKRVFGRELIIGTSHILESLVPYQLHSDVFHAKDIQGRDPEYSVIIPMDDSPSKTIVFNEWIEDSREFETFKQRYDGQPTLRLDRQFVLENLTHLHPKDLAYLTLRDVFVWRRGSMFAMDRRLIHCSDNFARHSINRKFCIILWTHS